MKHLLLFSVLFFTVVMSSISQFEVPPVSALDDSLPVLGSVMIDPSNHPITFHTAAGDEVYTDLQFDFSTSTRFVLDPVSPTNVPLTGSGQALRKMPGRTSYGAITVEAGITHHPAGGSSGTQTFDTEMLSLIIIGDGFMIRESPTLPSTGQLRRLPVHNLGSSGQDGVEISSFFDVFTELSIDGGATWMPADASVRLETKMLHAPVPVPAEAAIPQGVFNASYSGDPDFDLLSVTNSTSIKPGPPQGGTDTYTLSAKALVLFGGAVHMPSDVVCVVRATGSYADDTTKSFDTEMLQLSLSGGTLPAGVMIRESPTKASLGRITTTIRTQSVGQVKLALKSFFDVFLEISTDGGATWAERTPTTLEFTELLPSSEVPPVLAADDSLPTLGAVMLDPSNKPMTFHTSSGDVIFSDLEFDFTGSSRFIMGGTTSTVGAMNGTAKYFVLSTSRKDPYKNFKFRCSVGTVPKGTPGGGDINSFDTEMLSMDVEGNGFKLRESPTLPSKGQTTLRQLPDGSFSVQSFFDVFFELSMDGGATWTPAYNPIRLEFKIKPTVLINRPDPPPPFGRGVSVADLDGDGFQDLVVTNLSASLQPLGGGVVIHSDVCDVKYQYDGLDRLITNVPYSVRLHHTFDDGSDQYFDTEMLQLDISGGTLPGGVMLRESPSKASLGRTSLRSIPENSFEVSSFFDIFTELSIDGGQTWTPQSPATLEYRDTLRSGSGTSTACASVATYPDDLYPPAGMLQLKQGPPIVYSNGMRAKGIITVKLGTTTPRRELPPLGVTDVYDYDQDCDGLLDNNSGTGFTDFHATGTTSVRVTHSSDDGDVRTFDTEMLSLNLTGNLNGSVLMIRESPTRASTGRIRVGPNAGGYRISSFFDIFTEISLDGGATWFPSAESVRVEQELYPQEHEFASSNFPPPGVYDMKPACSEVQFENGVLFRVGSFFDIFAYAALPPSGGSSTNPAIGRARCAVSLDGGNSFFDVFFDMSMSARCDASGSSTDDSFFDTEMLSLDLHTSDGSTNQWPLLLRESPSKASLGRTSFRESPTQPSKGKESSFFDVFTEISLDGGQTWSPATSSMRMELDSVTNGSISGMKWHDVNGNGVNDGGETGLANWKIILADTLNTIIDTARTNVSGNYIFPNVPFGTYRIYEQLQPGWVQTGGSPAYGFMTAPGQAVTDLNFGNFQPPNITGYKFNDHNANGTRDAADEGLKDWEICLSQSSNPNTDIAAHGTGGSFRISLNGLPPGEPVTGTLTGFAASKKYRRVLLQQGRTSLDGHFENGDIPTEMLALDLHGTGQSSSGSFDVSLRKHKSAQNHLIAAESRSWDGTIKGRRERPPGPPTRPSFFDVFLDIAIDEPGVQRACRAEIILEGDLDGDGVPDPLTQGTVYRGGSATLYDDKGLQVGTLDSLEFTVGAPVSQSNPVCTLTNEDGQYNFAPMLPGTWNVTEHSQQGWQHTTPPPPAVVVTSGITIPPIDFGNFYLHDTLKYRTFTYEQLRDASQEKPKKVPTKKIPNATHPWYAPNTANLIEKILKDESGFMQVGQTGKLYPWGKPAPYLHPPKQGDVFKTFNDKKTPYHFNPPGGPQPMNYSNKGSFVLGWKKSIPPKDQNNILIAELLTLQVNIEASDKGHTTPGLGSLVYTWPGPWGHNVTIDSLASFGDKIMTNGVLGMITPMPVNPTDYDSLYNAVRRINLAFSSPVLDDTTTDGGWRAVPMKFKWKGAHSSTEYDFLISVPGITPRVRPTAVAEELPKLYALHQNYPNPFNPSTTIIFDLPEQAIVTLKIYNVLGQEVAKLLDHESMDAGTQDVSFNANNLPSGVYFYHITAEGISDGVDGSLGQKFVSVKKMLLLK